MTDPHHKKRFLKMPKYPGGSEAFREFIYSNLQYPQEAMDAGVEGSVIVEYDVHDNGKVYHPRIIKGIGYGCNEEAMRIVSLLRFETSRNRGVRLTMTNKTTINFVRPGIRINYSVSQDADSKPSPPEPPKDEPGDTVYGYTIKF